MSITKDQIIGSSCSYVCNGRCRTDLAMEEKFGVSAAAAVAVAAGPVEAAEEKLNLDVILKAAGANKVALSKQYGATGLV